MSLILRISASICSIRARKGAICARYHAGSFSGGTPVGLSWEPGFRGAFAGLDAPPPTETLPFRVCRSSSVQTFLGVSCFTGVEFCAEFCWLAGWDRLSADCEEDEVCANAVEKTPVRKSVIRAEEKKGYRIQIPFSVPVYLLVSQRLVLEGRGLLNSARMLASASFGGPMRLYLLTVVRSWTPMPKKNFRPSKL